MLLPSRPRGTSSCLGCKHLLLCAHHVGVEPVDAFPPPASVCVTFSPTSSLTKRFESSIISCYHHHWYVVLYTLPESRHVWNDGVTLFHILAVPRQPALYPSRLLFPSFQPIRGQRRCPHRRSLRRPTYTSTTPPRHLPLALSLPDLSHPPFGDARTPPGTIQLPPLPIALPPHATLGSRIHARRNLHAILREPRLALQQTFAVR